MFFVSSQAVLMAATLAPDLALRDKEDAQEAQVLIAGPVVSPPPPPPRDSDSVAVCESPLCRTTMESLCVLRVSCSPGPSASQLRLPFLLTRRCSLPEGQGPLHQSHSPPHPAPRGVDPETQVSSPLLTFHFCLPFT